MDVLTLLFSIRSLSSQDRDRVYRLVEMSQYKKETSQQSHQRSGEERGLAGMHESASSHVDS